MRAKIALISAIVLVALSLFFGSEHISAGLFATAKPAAIESAIPDHVLYESLFRMDISFRRKALEQELTGQTVTSLKHYFKDEANLTDVEDKILEQTAINFITEVEPIDAQARQMVATFREQFPDGEIAAGQQVPPPPLELANLQTQRNAVALRNRDKLSSLLGVTFAQFDSFVQLNFAGNFQSNGSVPRQ